MTLVSEASSGATILDRTPRRQVTRLTEARRRGWGSPLFITAENYPEQGNDEHPPKGDARRYGCCIGGLLEGRAIDVTLPVSFLVLLAVFVTVQRLRLINATRNLRRGPSLFSRKDWGIAPETDRLGWRIVTRSSPKTSNC